MRTLIDEDATQNDVLSIFQDLISKIQGSEGRDGRKEGADEKEFGRWLQGFQGRALGRFRASDFRGSEAGALIIRIWVVVN